MLRGNYVSLTPNLYNSRITADSSECKSTAETYKAEGNNIIWCSLSRKDGEYLCDWDATPSSRGSFVNGFTNYRYAVYYSPKDETKSISPTEYEEELRDIICQVKENNIKSDELIRKMVANAVSKKIGTQVKHIICSITNDMELESLEKILDSSDVDTFIKGYVAMFSGLEFLQSEISREAPKGVQVARSFEVDSLAIFDSDCVNIDRILNYKTREDVNFKDRLELSDLIERDKAEDKKIRKEFEERHKSAYGILKKLKVPSPYTEESKNKEETPINEENFAELAEKSLEESVQKDNVLTDPTEQIEFEMDNISDRKDMGEEIRKLLMEEPKAKEYTQEEAENTINQIVQFLNEIENLKVLENNQERQLNQLEQFIAINEFVTNRIYEESEKSHDIIGTCTTGKAVCEGLCKLTQLLCEQVGIKTLYKHSIPYDKNSVPVSNGHGNMEVFLNDKKGILHCLHFDPTIDSLKDKETMTYNTTLIPDENLQAYQYTQQWTSNTNVAWLDLAEGVTSEMLDDELTPNFMDEILGTDRLGRFRPHLIEMANCMELECEGDLTTKEQCIELYRRLYNKYQQAKLAIDNNEFLEALVNVQKAMLSYNTHLSVQEINEKAKQILKSRIELSIAMQQKSWDEKCKSSFIVDIVNGKFNFDEELERYTLLTSTQRLGKETLEELWNVTYLDETEKQEQIDIKILDEKTQEK